MTDTTRKRPAVLVTIAAVAGTVIAGIIATLSFGAQASVQPDGLPVAVAAPESGPSAGPARAAAAMVAERGGDELDVTVTSPERARQLLDDKDVYGVLELDVGERGPQATVVTSGAINPGGTQGAQQALTRAGAAVTTAMAEQLPDAEATPVQSAEVNAVGSAGRAAPLGVSALAWLGCMVAGAAVTVLAQRSGIVLSVWHRVATGAAVSVLISGLLVGFLALWDSSLPLGWEVIGLIALTAAAFAAVQGGLFHQLGLGAVALLGPLYLMAPAVAGQVPEMLHDGYRTALWSWTPFRFPTEGLRSLLAETSGAPDVATAVWVLTGMVALGLVLLMIPRRSAGQETEPDAPVRVVDVGVDETERLPRAKA